MDAIAWLSAIRTEMKYDKTVNKVHLVVVGEGESQHLEAAELGKWDKFLAFFGCGRASMKNVVSFMRNNLETKDAKHIGFNECKENWIIAKTLKDIFIKWSKEHSRWPTATKVQALSKILFTNERPIENESDTSPLISIKDNKTPLVIDEDTETEEIDEDESDLSTIDVETSTTSTQTEDSDDESQFEVDDDAGGAYLIDIHESAVEVIEAPLVDTAMQEAPATITTELIADLPEVIHDSYKTKEKDGTHLGKEELRLVDVSVQGVAMHNRSIEYLESLPASPEVTYRIQYHKQQLENLAWKESSDNKLTKGWFNSNYFRDLLGIFTGFYEGIAKYVSLPVNFNYHSIETGDYKTEGFHQVGVITYLPNGHTNLDEMRAMLKNDKLRKKKISKLNKLLKKRNKNSKKFQSLTYAKAQLQNTSALQAAIKERELALQSQMLIYLNNIVISSEDKIKTADETGATPYNFIHLGLLNQKSDSLDSSGWRHNELNEREDHYTAFKDLIGKKIIFDETKAPYFDIAGNVHIPRSRVNLTNNKEMVLNPVYLNATVQGHTENDGRQKEINRDNLPKLKNILISRLNEVTKGKIDETWLKVTYETMKSAGKGSTSSSFLKKEEVIGALENRLKATGISQSDLADVKKAIRLYAKIQIMEKRLENGESNYKLAEDLAVLCRKVDKAFSIGCLSAKDRTGVVGFRIIQRILKKFVKIEVTKKQLSSKKSKKQLSSIMEECATHLLKMTGVAVQNCMRNGWNYLKFSTLTLPEVNAWDRIAYAKRQINIF